MIKDGKKIKYWKKHSKPRIFGDLVALYSIYIYQSINYWKTLLDLPSKILIVGKDRSSLSGSIPVLHFSHRDSHRENRNEETSPKDMAVYRLQCLPRLRQTSQPQPLEFSWGTLTQSWYENIGINRWIEQTDRTEWTASLPCLGQPRVLKRSVYLVNNLH